MKYELGGLWALDAVQRYLGRVGGVPKSITGAVVESLVDGYPVITARLRFAADGEATTTEGFEPTDAEQAAIKAAMVGVLLPTQCESLSSSRPPALRDCAEEDVWCFRTVEGGVTGWQVRWEKEGVRGFTFWTYYTDGKWRPLEPDEGLPIWGLEQLNDFKVVFLHEGAKAARAMRAVGPEHPWYDDLKYAAHLGWIGGATNPGRTNWGPLARADVERVVVVADNDKVGNVAVVRVSRELPGKYVYKLQFTSEFPEGFDLGDTFPEKMFARRNIKILENGELVDKKVYVGAPLAHHLLPITWVTEQDGVSTTGKPKYKLNKAAVGMWPYLRDISRFCYIDNPTKLFSAEDLNWALKGFSHMPNCAPLLAADSSLMVHELGYKPQRNVDKIYLSNDGKMLVNTYKPSAVRPMEGDVTVWQNYLQRLFPVVEDRRFIERWVATMVARPEVRIKVALLLLSTMHGTGKSTLGNVCARLVGPHNTSEPSANTIVNSDYNDWVVHKKLAVVHEIYEGHSWKAYLVLKDKITEARIEVSKKYAPAYYVDVWLSLIMCSNHPDALRIEESDRRIFVPKVTEEKWKPDEAAEFYSWFNSGGDRIVRWWAETFTDYLPEGFEAPMSRQKAEVIDSSLDLHVQYQREVLDAHVDNPEPVVLTLSEWTQNIKEKFPQSASHVREPGVKGIAVGRGMCFVTDRFKVNGVKVRALLNPAARRRVEEECDLVFDRLHEQLVHKESGEAAHVSVWSDTVKAMLERTRTEIPF